MRPKSRTAEEVIAELAASAHGVVTRAQLQQAGVTPAEIKQRLRSGTLLREHQGVYRVGHRAPSTEASYLAAVLACGEGALLSGRAAGHLLGLLRGKPPAPEVTARTERRVKGIRTRRERALEPRDGMTWRGIPVTTVARTVVDLAASSKSYELTRACHEADVKHGITPDEVEAVLERRPNTSGAQLIRAILRGDTKITLSRLEDAFLARLCKEGLPLPITNRLAGGRRIDCRWPDKRLTVEIDSYRYHRSRHTWELDRRREREAHARDDRFRRYTEGDVLEQPKLMLRELRTLLA